jgi:hypothetical protein
MGYESFDGTKWLGEYISAVNFSLAAGLEARETYWLAVLWLNCMLYLTRCRIGYSQGGFLLCLDGQ